MLLNKYVAGESRSGEVMPPPPAPPPSVNPISSSLPGENAPFGRNEVTFLMQSDVWRGFEFGYKSVASLIEHGNLFSGGPRLNQLLVFHTVIFCDFKIRMLGDRLHRYTVQCVLPVNIYTEKIFTVLWFWLLLLNVLNIVDFVKWLVYYVSYRARFNFVLKHLLTNEASTYALASTAAAASASASAAAAAASTTRFSAKKLDVGALSGFRTRSTRNIVNKMLHTYLLHDNVFIIRLIALNTNEMITRELVTLLLTNFKVKNALFSHENTV